MFSFFCKCNQEYAALRLQNRSDYECLLKRIVDLNNHNISIMEKLERIEREIGQIKTLTQNVTVYEPSTRRMKAKDQ